MVNRAYYDEDNPVGDALFYVRRRRPANNFGPSQEQVYSLIQRTEGERGTRAGGEGPRLSPYRPLPGIGEAQNHLQPPPRPLVRERTYDVLKPRRRPPGAEASSLQFQNVDAEDNTPEEPRKPIKSILKKREQPGSQQAEGEHEGEWSHATTNNKQTRKEPPVEDPSTQLHSQLTTHETAHSYQHQHERLHQQQRLDSFDQRHQSRNHSLERDHPNPDNFSSDPSFTTEKLWKPTERPTRIHEKVEMEKQNSSQSTRHKTQQMSRRRNTTNHNTSGASGTSTTQGFTNRLRPTQGHFNPMDISRATLAFGPRMTGKVKDAAANQGSWFD